MRVVILAVWVCCVAAANMVANKNKTKRQIITHLCAHTWQLGPNPVSSKNNSDDLTGNLFAAMHRMVVLISLFLSCLHRTDDGVIYEWSHTHELTKYMLILIGSILQSGFCSTKKKLIKFRAEQWMNVNFLLTTTKQQNKWWTNWSIRFETVER